MDVDVRETVRHLVKDLTETGEWVLDAKKLKNLKSICKRSDALVQVTFEFIIAQLKKKHAQIRYSCVQLIEQLFERSKCFRDLLTEDFPLFTQLAVGIQDKRLPPPAHIAVKLRNYSIALIKSWFTKYGEKYRQLGIAYDFLMDNGFLDRETGSLSTIHTDDRNKSNTDVSILLYQTYYTSEAFRKKARRKAIQFNRFEILKADMNDHLDIIKDNLTNMEGCFEILVPKNVFQDKDLDFDALLSGQASSNQPAESDTYKDRILSHGLGSNRYQITIDMSEESLMEDIKETDDNRIVFDQLREAYTQLESKHMNQLNHWINTLVKMDLADKAEKEKWIKELINLKASATKEIRKAKLLKIEATHKPENRIDTTNMEEEDDEFGDELFEDVDVDEINAEGREKGSMSSLKLPPLQRIFPLSYDPSMMEDATYGGPPSVPEDRAEASRDKGKQKANPEKEELYKRAPVWGEDLYYWDKKNVQFNTSGIEKSHRFMGVGEGTNEMPEHLLDELRKRPIYYKSQAPKEIPVRACRHPLRNGSLCPRRDLVTCPFHGKIIPRDDLGRPLNPQDVATTSAAASKMTDEEYTGHLTSRKPDAAVMDNLWELLEGDVMSGQSGHEKITRKKKLGGRGGGVTKPKSALIDVKKKPDTSYTRLNKQISTAKNKKLVEEAIEYEREMKARNKQANSWR
ncbi:hypothetical protein [Parasitella parasitica]|uniref:UV-stimulated scaffold protein A C-terminal domain-containing protein n=1 Tax=Parasitella parasitica TaxID=35722 RepID=A0A0B7MZU2_9FUNG|nr:hypothetical protein [Parasitella parasitica]